MGYKLKYLNNLDQNFINKIAQMNIPNTDDPTDDSLWIQNSKDRIDTDLMLMDQAIELFSGN